MSYNARHGFQADGATGADRKEVATLARSFSLDYWLEKDRKAEYPTDWMRAFAQAGWLGMIIPEEYGGSGSGDGGDAHAPRGLRRRRRHSGASPIHFYLFPPMPVIKHGSEELKRRYLPRVATGEIVMSFGVTEPNAGTTPRASDAAERQGDRFVVNAAKSGIRTRTRDHMLLLARTSPRIRPSFAGMTLVLHPFDRSKITCARSRSSARRRGLERDLSRFGNSTTTWSVRSGAGFYTCSTR